VSARAFLCVSIDCECDKGPAWRTRRPLRFEGVHQGIAERLQPLFQHFGGKPTYLLSPELLRNAECVERLASFGGCELGTHLHGELAEPGAFEPEVTRAVQRDYPPEVERAKLAWLTQAFRGAFGRAPQSFRAGRFGIGASTISILDDLGYAVETSVTPHVDWSQVSPGLSFVGAPTQPYHPDPCNPGRPGPGRVLEVPVTVRPSALSRVPLLGKHVEPRWLRPTRTRGEALVALPGASGGPQRHVSQCRSRRRGEPLRRHRRRGATHRPAPGSAAGVRATRRRGLRRSGGRSRAPRLT